MKCAIVRLEKFYEDDPIARMVADFEEGAGHDTGRILQMIEQACGSFSLDPMAEMDANL